MLTIGPGPAPYFAYKIHHVERAKTAWILSEEFGEMAPDLAVLAGMTVFWWIMGFLASSVEIGMADGCLRWPPLCASFASHDGQARTHGFTGSVLISSEGKQGE